MSFRQAVVAAILSVALAANVHDRSYYEAKFFSWMTEHGIKASSGEHFVQMIQNFANNDDIIEAHNAQKASFTLGHNQFSHMNREEWKAFVQGFARPTLRSNTPVHVSTGTTLSSVDWIAKGAVAGVKDQGQCGSCWAFSTVGALEGAYQIANGNLQTFSEQNLVSCDNRSTKGTDLGCKGGLMDSAFEWTQANGGLCTEDAYPYVSGTTKKNEDCKQSSCTLVKGVTPKSWTDIKANDEEGFLNALSGRPIAVAIEADEPAFQLYKSGVFDAACGTNLDHGVLAVGFGTDSASGKDFYNVRNSWGKSWGEGGYIRFIRGGKTQKEGQCGILSQASYVTV